MNIRFATPNDLGTIERLIRGLAEYEKLLDQVELETDNLRRFLFGERPYAEVLIVEDDGEPLGFALFFHNFSTFLGRPGIYLEDIFVRPEHRGRGHGRALLGEIARIAVERECGRIEWSVLDWNETAIAFYRGLGAEPVDGWTVYRMSGGAIARLAGSRGALS
jgi:GNAT superfamily N-acetyltransferase